MANETGTKRVAPAAPAAAKGTPVPAAPQTAAAAGAAPAAEPAKRGGGLTRDVFDFKTAVNAQNQPVWVEKDGKVLLTAVPANYDVRKHKALEKENFTSDQNGEASFYDYKAAVADSMRAIYEKSVNDYRAQAANVRKYGNAEQRKLASKAQAMASEFGALLAQMRKEGVDTADLEAMMKTQQA